MRYNALKKTNPAHADELLAKNKHDAQRRYRQLKRLSVADFSDEIVADDEDMFGVKNS